MHHEARRIGLRPNSEAESGCRMTDVRHAVGELWQWARGRRRRVRVQGQSMVPTLESGQFVLCEPGGHVEVGDVVVARHPSQAIEIVKRVASIDPIGLVELLSDNPDDGTDSRTFGRIDVGLIQGTVTISLDWPFPAVERR